MFHIYMDKQGYTDRLAQRREEGFNQTAAYPIKCVCLVRLLQGQSATDPDWRGGVVGPPTVNTVHHQASP